MNHHILTQDMFNFAYVINPKCNKSYLPGCNTGADPGFYVRGVHFLARGLETA